MSALPNVSPLAERLYDLFVANPSQYLRQKKDGTYSTIKRRLTARHFQKHIEGTETIGVFANETESKFITFDIDVSIKSAIPPLNIVNWATYAVIDAIYKAGIQRQYIYPSRSGKKGMHVDIYFTEAVPLEMLKTFFDYVVEHSGINGNHYFYGHEIRVNIELRPTNQGVKIPLGIHKATGNRCWYVDRDDLNHVYDTIEYINEIQQLDVNEFYNVIEWITDRLDSDDVTTNDDSDNQAATNEGHSPIVVSEMTHSRMMKYLSEGLEEYGTRHNVTFQLALYMKDVLGYDEGQTLQALIDWLDKQTKYSTPYKEAVKDTENIVKDVFTKGYRFNAGRTKITFTKEEIHRILTSTQTSGKATTPKQKAVMFALLTHSKRYADADGVFYMTYKQISEASGVTQDRNIKAILDELAAIDYLEIIRRNAKEKGKTKALPNLYRIREKEKDVSPDNTHKEHVTHTHNDIIELKTIITHFYKKDELKILLPRRQYEFFTKN